MTVATTLPTFESRLGEIAAAEQGEGWLCTCDAAGRFLLACRELVVSLAKLLASLDDGPVLEVCAGRGELADWLHAEGMPIVATDADPPVGSSVQRASAEEALDRYRPAVVLGSFVPIDSGVDRLVMSFPSVRHYVVLAARIGGLLGSAALWEGANWMAKPRDEISPWMLTRHDVWIDTPEQTILQHGKAWHFRRRDSIFHQAQSEDVW